MGEVIKTCLYCRRQFKAKAVNQLYCSMDCRVKYYAEYPDEERTPVNYTEKTLKCSECGKIVPRKSGQQKYCQECSIKVIKRKKKKREAEYRERERVKKKSKRNRENDHPEIRANALGMTYGKYVAIMDGYLPGKDDLLKREAEIFGKRSKVDKNHHRHI